VEGVNHVSDWVRGRKEKGRLADLKIVIGRTAEHKQRGVKGSEAKGWVVDETICRESKNGVVDKISRTKGAPTVVPLGVASVSFGEEQTKVVGGNV